MQLAVSSEGVPNTRAWSRLTTFHVQWSTDVGGTTSRTGCDSVALQRNRVVARIVDRRHACEVTRSVVLVGFWVVVVRRGVRATQDDARRGELEVTASALVVGPNHEVVVRVGLELWQEAFNRTSASAGHDTSNET